ncbi:hypothetical protein [Serratia sp. OS31]|uniref:hypothetical protein n=1 Tax=Serratia sp. OS31 TaxID=2760844 RepID=UPI0016026C73|nr:hypothetical protein [Serratia sp. OS31]MBB1585109.1 hypothetical protein [Serratia sp. OS31]
MKEQIKVESYFTRNERLLRALIPSIILVLMPIMLGTVIDSSEMVVPQWVFLIPQVVGWLGIIYAGICCRLTQTLTARLLEAAVVLFGISLLIYNVYLWLS